MSGTLNFLDVVFIAIFSLVIAMPAAKFFCRRHRNKMRRKLVSS